MKNIYIKFNLIFTGKFLYLWYLAFAISLIIAFVSGQKNKNASLFDLTVFNRHGEVINKRVVDKNEIKYINFSTPVTKTYRPIK